MHPGKRPHRATFLKPSGARDSIGNVDRTPVPIGTAWVSLEPLSAYARERLSSAGESAEVNYRIELARPRFNIPASGTVSVAGRTFEIRGLMDDPASRDIAVLCFERSG